MTDTEGFKDPYEPPEGSRQSEYQLTHFGEVVLRALFDSRRDRLAARTGSSEAWEDYFSYRITPDGRVRMTHHELDDMFGPLMAMEEIPPLIEREMPPDDPPGRQ